MAHDIDVILINFKYEETELLKKNTEYFILVNFYLKENIQRDTKKNILWNNWRKQLMHSLSCIRY
jgi:hypothetical protein